MKLLNIFDGEVAGTAACRPYHLLNKIQRALGIGRRYCVRPDILLRNLSIYPHHPASMSRTSDRGSLSKAPVEKNLRDRATVSASSLNCDSDVDSEGTVNTSLAEDLAMVHMCGKYDLLLSC